ncbi:MAG TPA: hypothetical protein VFD82_20115 [Planctomycetota bacterium]|nr:hypothetical protein [Planctomycetota bacterium]
MTRARALQALLATLLLLLQAFAPGVHRVQHALSDPSDCAACCCGRQHHDTNANARRIPVVRPEVAPAERCCLCDLLATPLPMRPAPAVAVPSLPWPLCAVVRPPVAAVPSVASFDLYRVRAPPRTLLV